MNKNNKNAPSKSMKRTRKNEEEIEGFMSRVFETPEQQAARALSKFNIGSSKTKK